MLIDYAEDDFMHDSDAAGAKDCSDVAERDYKEKSRCALVESASYI